MHEATNLKTFRVLRQPQQLIMVHVSYHHRCRHIALNCYIGKIYEPRNEIAIDVFLHKPPHRMVYGVRHPSEEEKIVFSVNDYRKHVEHVNVALSMFNL